MRSLPGGQSLGWGVIEKIPGAGHTTEFSHADQYSVVWLLEGTGIYRDGEGEVKLEPGDLVHRVPGRTHSTVATSRWVEVYLQFPLETYQSLEAFGPLAEAPKLWKPGVEEATLRSWMELEEPLRRASLEGTLILLLQMQGRLLAVGDLHRRRQGGAKSQGALDEAVALLQTNLGQARSIPEVARAVGMTHETFRKAFRDRFGRSPRAHQDRVRLDAAKERLLEGQMRVQEIAQTLGFANPYVFSRRFREEMGLSPREYRKRYR